MGFTAMGRERRGPISLNHMDHVSTAIDRVVFPSHRSSIFPEYPATVTCRRGSRPGGEVSKGDIGKPSLYEDVTFTGFIHLTGQKQLASMAVRRGARGVRYCPASSTTTNVSGDETSSHPSHRPVDNPVTLVCNGEKAISARASLVRATI